MSKAFAERQEDGQEKLPAPTPEQTTPAPKEFSWWDFMESADDSQIQKKLPEQIKKIAEGCGFDLSKYCVLSLYEPHNSIDTSDSNRIFAALQAQNPNKDKDVFLLIACPGGRIEPAYQISKICKAFANERFVVAVPRAAKSAATLITLGADQIHMGLLGELGPIDPQLGDLPALGVKRALETIASVCQQYPRSAEAFSLYMSKRLTVEQIGYCERVVESAVQYAERLLANKPFLKHRANYIAKQLVYEYKHHGFVIDLDEARGLLGESWILNDSVELAFAEKVYQFFDVLSIFADTRQDKTLLVIGDLNTGVTTYDKE